MSNNDDYKRGYQRGYEAASKGQTQTLPSENGMSLGEHLLLNIILPGVGTIISLADAMEQEEKLGDCDKGYIAGYRDGLQKFRNDSEYRRIQKQNDADHIRLKDTG